MKPKLALLSTLILVVMACGMAANEDALFFADEASDTTTAEGPATTGGESSHTDADDEETSHDHNEASHEEAESTHDDAEGSMSHEEATHGHSSEADASDHEADRTVEVTMSDFAFAPGVIEVAAGETIEFLVDNEGSIEHEFRLTSPHGVEDHMSGGHNHDESADHEMLVAVPAGGTDTLMVTFTEDADVELYACLLPGHYEAGMAGELVIES